MLVVDHPVGEQRLPDYVDFDPLEDIGSRLTVPMRDLRVVDSCISNYRIPGSSRFYSQVDLVPSRDTDDYFMALHIRSTTDPREFVTRLSSPGSCLFNWLESIDRRAQERGGSLLEEPLVLSWRITSPRLALSAASKVMRY